ncbi:hypothetical protein N2152v2_009249 [Parachlorella kessleri]
MPGPLPPDEGPKEAQPPASPGGQPPSAAASGKAAALPVPAWMVDESAWSTDLDKGSATYHAPYSLERDVILRMEVISSTQCKILTLLSALFTLVTALALIAETIVKALKDPTEIFISKDSRYFTSSLATGCILLGALLFVLAHFSWRLVEATRKGRQWSRRRKRMSLLAFSQLVLQTINTVLWVTISAYVMGPGCGWHEMTVVMMGWAQWTVWNTEFLLILIQGHSGNVWRGGKYLNTAAAKGDEEDATQQEGRLILDAPWSIHALKLIPWVLMEIVVSLMTRNLSSKLKQQTQGQDCSDVEITCSVGTSTTTYISLMVSQVFIVFATLVLSDVLLLLYKLDSCWSFVFSWFGMLPMHVAASSMVIVLSWYFMPRHPDHHDQILRVWLQEFAWTAASVPSCLARRNHHLETSAQLAAESMFCVETAIRLLYWSGLVYDYDEVPETPFDLDFALDLYRLEGAEMLWDQEIDTKALVGWSKEGRVVIAFRGTASLANVKTDLKMWQVVHPPKRRRAVSSLWGLRYLRRTVKVHTGFWQAWAGRLPAVPQRSQSVGSAVLGAAKPSRRQPASKQEKEWREDEGEEGGKAEEVVVCVEVPPLESQQHQQRDLAVQLTGGRQRTAQLCSLLPSTSLPGQRQAGLGLGHPGKGENGFAAAGAQQRPTECSQIGRIENGCAAAVAQQRHRVSSSPGPQSDQDSTQGNGVDSPKEPELVVETGQLDTADQARVPYNEALLALVTSIIESHELDPSHVSFHLTGHSLGGAMASLAAVELQQRWPSSSLQVYTYGQPRVGNRAFAAEYDALVKDHWSVICDQDPVPRVPKTRYKRSGSRVVVNGKGDLIVRPTFLESSILNGTGVVGDHLLERYRAAFASVLKAQFTSKRLPEGERGVVDLSKQVDLGRVLMCENLDLASLRDAASRPITLEAAQRQQQMRDRSLHLNRHLSLVRRAAASLCRGLSGPARASQAVAQWAAEELPPLVEEGPGEAGAVVEVPSELQGEELAAALDGGGVTSKAAAAIRAQSLRVRQRRRQGAGTSLPARLIVAPLRRAMQLGREPAQEPAGS